MLFTMSHFFVKAIVFIELVNAIYFSIVFTFRISAMRLFKFLNISRIWLINTLLFLKMESLLADSGILKMNLISAQRNRFLQFFFRYWFFSVQWNRIFQGILQLASGHGFSINYKLCAFIWSFFLLVYTILEIRFIPIFFHFFYS